MFVGQLLRANGNRSAAIIYWINQPLRSPAINRRQLAFYRTGGDVGERHLAFWHS